MFDFLVPIVAIVAAYMVFELLIRRRERLFIIEKMGDKLTPDLLKPQFMPNLSTTPVEPRQRRSGYGALKAACLCIGIGLGLLVAFFVNLFAATIELPWHGLETIYGAGVLLFGGLGLLVAYLIESKAKK